MRNTKICRERKYPFCHVFVSITEACNLSCRHCYLGDTRLSKSLSLSYHTIRHIMDYFLALGTSRLTFLGGEPTLHKDFPRIVKEAYDLGFDVLVDTNGIFPQGLLNQIRNDQITYLNFSVDGSTAGLHEMIRGPSTFDKCLDNLQHALDLGFNVGVVDTLNAKNIEDAHNVIALATELGVPFLNFHKMTSTGRAVKSPSCEVRPRRWMEFVEFLERVEKPKTIDILYPPSYATQKSLPKYLKKGYNGCTARRFERVSIYSDKSAYLCTLMLDKPLNFAHFRQEGLVMNKEANETDLIFSVSKCAGCRVQKECRYGCSVLTNLQESKCDYVLGNDVIPLCALWKILA